MSGDPFEYAEFSSCWQYRYVLRRRWGTGHYAAWVMLNPSIADAEKDDPTIRRCVGFSKRFGFDGLEVVNLFAKVSTDPKTIATCDDAVGSENDDYISKSVLGCGILIYAWGVQPFARQRAREVDRTVRSFGITPFCLKVTAAGHPGHPLYVKSDQELIPWTPRTTRY